nr:unnamed protein product [Digitaria exilis]
MWPLLLLPLFLAAAAANASVADEPPPPMAPWPEQFHALVITNLTSSGGRLQLIDLYYDWPRGRDLNLIRDQLADSNSGDPPVMNVEWANGTAYLFDATSCRTFQFDIGLLPPNWKAHGGAAYLGRRRVDGFDCHVWSNFLFERYYEDVVTGRPVAWSFMGASSVLLLLPPNPDSLIFEVGGVLEDSSMWQAPAYCFDGSNGDVGDGVDGHGSRDDEVNSLISFAGPGLRRLPRASFGHGPHCTDRFLSQLDSPEALGHSPSDKIDSEGSRNSRRCFSHSSSSSSPPDPSPRPMPRSHCADGPAPVPTPWPEQFHAVVFTNLTESGGKLQLIDLYYDWPKGRNLNLIQNQLSGDPTYDVEWTNGTSYYFDSGTCRTVRFPVGLLPPDWLAGAVYLGRELVDGFDCHLWTKVDFIWYYEEAATGRPQHVMSFEVGGVLEDSKWQAPAYCFNGDNADTANVASDGVDVMNSSLTSYSCII